MIMDVLENVSCFGRPVRCPSSMLGYRQLEKDLKRIKLSKAGPQT